jgi:hypothetical protein
MDFSVRLLAATVALGAILAGTQAAAVPGGLVQGADQNGFGVQANFEFYPNADGFAGSLRSGEVNDKPIYAGTPSSGPTGHGDPLSDGGIGFVFSPNDPLTIGVPGDEFADITSGLLQVTDTYVGAFRQATLTFYTATGQTDTATVNDFFSVPEPAAWAFMLLGTVAIGASARERRRRTA